MQFAALVAAALALIASAPQALHRDAFEVIENCSLDLESGDCACIVIVDGDGSEQPGHPKDKKYDIWLQPDGKGLYLAPMHRTQLAKGDLSERGFEGCSTAGYAKGRVRIDGLLAGSHICVLTGRGQYVELRLEKVAKPGAQQHGGGYNVRADA